MGIGSIVGAIGSAISPGLGGLLGAGLGMLSGSQRNKAQEELAQNQMDFQERMSSSAYQRAMADMRKAGLNPMLAYKQGGASTPAGAMAQLQDPIQSAGVGASSAAQIAKIAPEVKQIEAAADLAIQQKNTSWADEYLKGAQYVEKKVFIDILEERLKIAQRDGEIAESDAGQWLRWIREARESVFGGGISGSMRLNPK